MLCSGQVLLQIVDFLHFFEQFLLTIVFAFCPLLAQDLAVGNGLAEGNRVEEVVLEDARVSTHAGDVVSVVFLAEVSVLVRDIQVVQLVPE